VHRAGVSADQQVTAGEHSRQLAQLQAFADPDTGTAIPGQLMGLLLLTRPGDQQHAVVTGGEIAGHLAPAIGGVALPVLPPAGEGGDGHGSSDSAETIL
jgi:hypothetical protein